MERISKSNIRPLGIEESRGLALAKGDGEHGVGFLPSYNGPSIPSSVLPNDQRYYLRSFFLMQLSQVKPTVDLLASVSSTKSV